MKHKQTERVIAVAKRKKRRSGISEEYLSRKSIHVRILPEINDAMKALIMRHEIPMQGVLEFFMCQLIDGDESAHRILRKYKAACRKTGMLKSEADIDEIFDAIEDACPFDFRLYENNVEEL